MKDKSVDYIKLSEECKNCIRYGHPVHQCGGRVIQPTPCMAFTEEEKKK